MHGETMKFVHALLLLIKLPFI